MTQTLLLDSNTIQVNTEEKEVQKGSVKRVDSLPEKKKKTKNQIFSKLLKE